MSPEITILVIGFGLSFLFIVRMLQIRKHNSEAEEFYNKCSEEAEEVKEEFINENHYKQYMVNSSNQQTLEERLRKPFEGPIRPLSDKPFTKSKEDDSNEDMEEDKPLFIPKKIESDDYYVPYLESTIPNVFQPNQHIPIEHGYRHFQTETPKTDNLQFGGGDFDGYGSGSGGSYEPNNDTQSGSDSQVYSYDD